MLTAQQWNQYIVANFTEGVPGQVAAKGDLIVGDGQDRATRLPIISGGYTRRRGLRVNSAGSIAWDQPVYWRWAAVAPYDLAGGNAHTPIPMASHAALGVTPVAENNSSYVVLPEDGTYEFILSLLILTGVNTATINQVAQGYVSVDDTDTQMCRWTVSTTTSAQSNNLMNGNLILPNLTAGQVIRFKVRNEMYLRISLGYGCMRRVR